MKKNILFLSSVILLSIIGLVHAQTATPTAITTTPSAIKVITAASGYITSLQSQLTTAQASANANAAAAADDVNAKAQITQMVGALNTLNLQLPATNQVTGP